MSAPEAAKLERYQRQTAFPALGAGGQQLLMKRSVLVVGLGRLGSWKDHPLSDRGMAQSPRRM